MDLRFSVVVNLASGEENEDQNFKASIPLDLKPRGRISTDFKWDKSIDNSCLSTEGEKTGEAEAKISFKLVGDAKAKGDVYWVTVEAGASMGIEAEKEEDVGGVGLTATLTTTTAEDKSALAGQLVFSGMNITYSCFVKVSVNVAKSADDGGFGAPIFKKVKELAKKAEKTVKKEGDLPVFDKIKWPADPKPTPIDQGHI